MSRISFFFAARWLAPAMPEIPMRTLLKEHTPLLCHALDYSDCENNWDNPDCRHILARADALKAFPPEEFEERMWQEIRPTAMERAENFYPQSVGMAVPGDWNAGSLKYDPPSSNRPLNYCNFHIANAVAPDSIFADPAYLPLCFLEMMAKSEAEYAYDTLVTHTWLNDNQRWLRLFPREWIVNLSPRENIIYWHFGNWGQLVTARGTFNRHAGQYVREQGRLRYRARASHCSFDAMRKHLTEILKQVKQGD
ncbi:MAG: hypothetical protein PHV59_02810 [Victivallales bacterium]|nr:hypothetical protein [Victivallales bacterium]